MRCCVVQSRLTRWASYLRLRSGCITWWRTGLDVRRRAPPPDPPYAPPRHCWRTLLTRSLASRPLRPLSLPPLTIGKCWWSGSPPPLATLFAPPCTGCANQRGGEHCWFFFPFFFTFAYHVKKVHSYSLNPNYQIPITRFAVRQK